MLLDLKKKKCFLTDSRFLYVVKEILNLCPAETLMPLYKLERFGNVDEFLQKVATIRGKLKKGGIVDVEAAARIVLHDWNEGFFFNNNFLIRILIRSVTKVYMIGGLCINFHFELLPFLSSILLIHRRAFIS